MSGEEEQRRAEEEQRRFEREEKRRAEREEKRRLRRFVLDDPAGRKLSGPDGKLKPSGGRSSGAAASAEPPGSADEAFGDQRP